MFIGDEMPVPDTATSTAATSVERLNACTETWAEPWSDASLLLHPADAIAAAAASPTMMNLVVCLNIGISFLDSQFFLYRALAGT
jgi:hypothetical protein